MKKKTIRIVAFFVALITLFSLVACSSEQNGNETKAPTGTTVPITTESVAPTQVTTLPATTEAQTEPASTEPAVDISNVDFKEVTINGAKYLAPSGWTCTTNDYGTKFYNADKPDGGYIYVYTVYSLANYDSFYDEYVSALVDNGRSEFPDYTAISTERITVNGIEWAVDKLECTETESGDFRFTIQKDGVFQIGAIYPKAGSMIPRFLAIYEKMFESVDVSDLYIERPLTSLMDLENDIVLVDNESVKITFEDITYDTSLYAYQPTKVNLLIENKTESTIMITVDDFSVNGFMCNTYLYTSVAGKKKARDSMAFTDSELQSVEISSPYDMEEMEWSFTVYNSDSFETIGKYPVKLSIYD